MFDIIEFITRIFKKDTELRTRSRAKERLKLVLVSDRASISPHLMESLREELIEVISRYMTIDTNSMEMNLERKDGSMAIAALIPVLSMNREGRVKKRKSSGSNGPVSKAKKEIIANTEKPEEKHLTTGEEEKEEKMEALAVAPLPVGNKSEKEETSRRRKGKKSKRRYSAKAHGRTLRKRA